MQRLEVSGAVKL